MTPNYTIKAAMMNDAESSATLMPKRLEALDELPYSPPLDPELWVDCEPLLLLLALAEPLAAWPTKMTPCMPAWQCPGIMQNKLNVPAVLKVWLNTWPGLPLKLNSDGDAAEHGSDAEACDAVCTALNVNDTVSPGDILMLLGSNESAFPLVRPPTLTECVAAWTLLAKLSAVIAAAVRVVKYIFEWIPSIL